MFVRVVFRTLKFSWPESCPPFVEFAPSCCSLWCQHSGNCCLILLSDLLASVCRNTTGFLFIDLESFTLMGYTGIGSFRSSLSTWRCAISLFCLLVLLAAHFRTALDRNRESCLFFFFLVLGESPAFCHVIIRSSLSLTQVVGLLWVLYWVKDDSFLLPVCWRVCVWVCVPQMAYS